MNKRDYLEVKENYRAYKRFYKTRLILMMFLIFLPIIISIRELFVGQFISHYILGVFYAIAIVLYVFMKPYFKKNPTVQKYFYYQSFHHLVDKEFSKEEIDLIANNYKKQYGTNEKTIDSHQQVYINQIELNIYENAKLETIKNCIKSKDRTVVNVFLNKSFTEEEKDTIIYEIPEELGLLVLNVGYEKSTKHVFFCANDLMTLTPKDKNQMKRILTTLFTLDE